MPEGEVKDVHVIFVDQMTGMPFREIRTKEKGTANKAAGKTRLVDWFIDILAVL